MKVMRFFDVRSGSVPKDNIGIVVDYVIKDDSRQNRPNLEPEVETRCSDRHKLAISVACFIDFLLL